LLSFVIALASFLIETNLIVKLTNLLKIKHFQLRDKSKKYKYIQKQVSNMLTVIQISIILLIINGIVSKISEPLFDGNFREYILMALIIIIVYLLCEILVLSLLYEEDNPAYEKSHQTGLTLIASFLFVTFLAFIIFAILDLSQLIFTVIIYGGGYWFLSDDYSVLAKKNIERTKEKAMWTMVLTIQLISFSTSNFIMKLLITNLNYVKFDIVRIAFCNFLITLFIALIVFVLFLRHLTKHNPQLLAEDKE
jgi:membrane protein